MHHALICRIEMNISLAKLQSNKTQAGGHDGGWRTRNTIPLTKYPILLN